MHCCRNYQIITHLVFAYFLFLCFRQGLAGSGHPVELDDELDGAVVVDEIHDESEVSEEEYQDSDCSLAESLGYTGDREQKWLPPHNVSSVGPKIVWARGSAPCRALDFFLLFFSFDLMGTIIENSNIYAVYGQEIGQSYMSQDHGCHVWRPIDLMEFRRFLACLFYMGIVKAPARRNYWQNDKLFSGLLGSMFIPTFSRYCGILAALHCVNPETEDKSDPLGKIRNFYDHMRSRCKELFTPGKCVSIDERMVKSKGRFFFKQYIMNKPTKWGFKLWVLADSATGYNWDMVVYTGKSRKDDWDDFTVVDNSFEGIERGLGRAKAFNENPNPENAGNLINQLAARVVINLTKPLINRGYVLFADNFYCSVPLFQYLISVGINAVGTVRENSSSFPEVMKNRQSWGKKLDRGTIRYIRNGEKPNDVLLVQWVDRNVVSVLSTYHSANDYDYCTRNTKVDGSHKKVKVLRPKCISDYNKDMNGVDLSDQMYHMYSVQYRTKKFWKTLFFHFVDICAWDAYVFWRELRNPTPEQKMPKNYSFLDFKKDLALQLAFVEQKAITAEPEVRSFADLGTKVSNVEDFICKAKAHAVNSAKQRSATVKKAVSKKELWQNRLEKGHLPVKLEKHQVCKVCSVMKSVHSIDQSYRAKTSSFCCVVCDIPLCIGERNCFLLFHSPEFEQYKEAFLSYSRDR